MKPRILLCGAGRWGRNYARVLSKLGLLTVVCDPDEEALLGACSITGEGPVFIATPFSEVLSDPGLAAAFDAVVIATPAETHFELTHAAIEAGCHVLVEKPMAMDSRAAEQLVEEAEARGVKLQVGHIFEHNPGVLRLLDWIEKGRLGQLEYLFSHQLSPGRIRQKEDVLLSLAPHDVSILLMLAGGMPSAVTAFGEAHAHPEVAGMSVVHMVFGGDGTRAHFHVSWLHPEKERRVVAVGHKAAAVLDDRASVLTLYERERGHNPFPTAPVKRFQYLTAEPLTLQCEAFAAWVGGGPPPRTTGRAALGVMAVIDAARRSLLSGSLTVPIYYGEAW